MKPERWQKIERLCQSALDRDEHARDAFLDEACAGDEELRRDVESLLERAAKAQGFLEAPALEVVAKGLTASDAFEERTRDPAFQHRRLPPLGTGAVFGSYRILGLIGQGGMGIVYEAEEIDSGRRLALKVMNTPLQSQKERERFLLEGRLAASIAHPHCVYVFAAFEIDARPVIALELMEGTLAQRLRRDGPLTPAAAVTSILQVIQGLEAAARVGILHRDIKPANCFVGSGGIVKIGDFGISRSTHGVMESTTRMSGIEVVVGTPAYAAPEQLRGAPLDTRSDIYGVGATLFELLTGRPPFVADDLMAMLVAVANDVPPAPHRLNPAIPRGLAAVVLRCLAKKPEQRLPDYPHLTAALEPYASMVPIAATLGRRFLGGTIDLVILSTPLILGLRLLDRTVGEAVYGLGASVAPFATATLYFGILEGLWGSTPGKAFCGLTTVRASGQRAGGLLLFARALVYAACFASMWFVSTREPDALLRAVGGPSALVILLLLALLPVAIAFSSARRRNGLAALHDWVTDTRVVERRAATPGVAFRPSDGLSRREVVAQVGPYDVLSDPVAGLAPGWRWGYDPRLRRAVWIRFSVPGTPAVSAGRKAVVRDMRLRWLAGRRTGEEVWDAYEAVEGIPIGEATSGLREWTDLRWWLLDLARECLTMTQDASAPRDPRHVWLLTAGGVKWLDDPAADPAGADMTDQQFLAAVASTALGGHEVARHTLPLGARRFLEHLATESARGLDGIVRELDGLTRQRAVVTRSWRLAPVVIYALVPMLFVTTVTLASVATEIRRHRVSSSTDRSAGALLKLLRAANDGFGGLLASERQAIEEALVIRYRDVLADGRLFVTPTRQNLDLTDDDRKVADEALRHYPGPFVATTRADARVALLIRRATGEEALPPRVPRLLEDARGAYVLMSLFALAASLISRRASIRVMGFEIVTADGRPATRLRMLARTAITWSPVLLGAVVTRYVPDPAVGFLIPWWMLGMLGGALVIAISPVRGIPDRLVSTWVVPR